jgi:hypothetical protein
MKKILSWLFREDLNLKSRWWHRFLFIVYILTFVYMIGLSIYTMLDNAKIPRYTEVGMLSDRMNSELQLIGDLVKPGEKIAMYEHNLYGSYEGKSSYEGNGGWLLEQEFYCSNNISDQVDNIILKTGVKYYTPSGTYLGSLEDFKNYLIKNKANCVDVRNLDSVERFGNIKKALGWGLEADGMKIYEASFVESVFYVLANILLIVIGYLLLLIIYYKIVLYIIFGGNKK